MGTYVNFKKNMMNKLVLGGKLWVPNIMNIIQKAMVFLMIFIFANVWFVDDVFNVYEFQEKQNTEY